MMMPPLPVAAFVVIQTEFFWEWVIILLALPPALDEPYDTSPGVVRGKVTEAELERRLFRLRPLRP